MFADNAKLVMIGLLKGRAAIGRHFDMLEIRDDRKITEMLNIRFSKGKCKVFHLGVISPMYQYRHGTTGHKAVLQKRTDPQSSSMPTLCSSQDYLKLNHMAKSIVLLLFYN